MKYLHSRLALAGVVVAWPLTQLAGCSQKERNFNPGGTGGDSNGGLGGEDTGATGGKGGTAGKGGTTGKGGTAGNSGGTGGGGKGGTGGGSGGKAGATTGGTGGSGNTNAGGEAGETMVDPTCTPTGVEVCNDGIDNDCDTLTDCVTLVSSFPEENGAAAGEHVQYTFRPKHADGTYQCRAVKGDVMPAAEEWGSCASVSGDTVLPITAAATAAATTDGVWSTEVRLLFPDDSHSRAFRRKVYVHSSLNGVTPCADDGVEDDAWFAAAAADLEVAGAFDQTTVRSPFVQIQFAPPVDARYAVASGDGVVRTYSLRRRFVFNDDGTLLLITRNYPSRLGGWACDAVSKRVHNTRGTWSLGFHVEQHCDAFVMNSKGAGYCLNAGAGGVAVSAEWVRGDYAAQIPDAEYSPRADNFAWRKIFSTRSIGGFSTNFSPKCDVDGCGTATALFLPDAALYPYW